MSVGGARERAIRPFRLFVIADDSLEGALAVSRLRDRVTINLLRGIPAGVVLTAGLCLHRISIAGWLLLTKAL
jgi:hypothetical protein